MFTVPVLLGGTFGAVHYIKQSFVVYLKYQALVDSYYLHKYPQNQEEEKFQVLSSESQSAQELTDQVQGESSKQ